MKKLIIILAAVFVLVAGTATGIVLYNNQPKIAARNAVVGAVSDLLDRDEIEPVADMLDGGSLELDANIDLGIFDSLSVSGKIYFSDDAVMVKDFKAGSLELGAYFSHDLSYVTNDDVLGGSYGVIRGRMSETFKNNSFWRTKLLTDEQVVELDRLFDSYDRGVYKDFDDDIEKYSEKYSKILLKAFEKNAVYSSDVKSIEIDGEQTEVREIYVSIDEEGMLDIAKTLFDELKNDKKLRESLSVYLGDGISMYDEALGSLEGFFEEEHGSGGGEVMAITIITPVHSSKLLRIEVEDVYKGARYSAFTLDAGKEGIKKTDKITVTLGADTIIEMSVDKKSDTFKLSIPTYDIELSGGLVKKGNTLTVTPRLVKLGLSSIDDLDIKIIIRERDKMPAHLKKKEVKTVFEMPSNDLKNILYSFGIDVSNDPDLGGSGDGFLGDDDEIE